MTDMQTDMQSDPAEIKPAQCCIKLVFHLTYTMMHGSTKLKFLNSSFTGTSYTCRFILRGNYVLERETVVVSTLKERKKSEMKEEKQTEKMKATPKNIGVVVGIYINNRIFVSL